jgi:ribonuclease VapC
MAMAIAKDPIRAISGVSVLEASIVVAARTGPDGMDDLDLLLAKLQCDVRPFAAGDLSQARGAFLRFGKGRHPAALNFGDCFSYCLAAVLGEPLLFKGKRFFPDRHIGRELLGRRARTPLRGQGFPARVGSLLHSAGTGASLLKDELRKMGVVGAGGAGFPTAVKAESEVEFVLANGAECEPLIHKDAELMTHFPQGDRRRYAVHAESDRRPHGDLRREGQE